MGELGNEIIPKLFEWPFLLFLGSGILVRLFRTEISKLIVRGGVSLSWGDKSFEISELPEQLNENFAPVSDDIEDLKMRIEALEEGHKLSPKGEAILAEEQKRAATQKMLHGLNNGSYRWRSIERLASMGGISKKQAEDILRPLDETVFGIGKSGRTIVRADNR